MLKLSVSVKSQFGNYFGSYKINKIICIMHKFNYVCFILLEIGAARDCSQIIYERKHFLYLQMFSLFDI